MLKNVLITGMVLLVFGCAGIKIMQPLRTTPSDWVMYGGNAQRQNARDLELRPPLRLLWEYNALAGIRATPVVRDSIVLLATLHGELQAVHIRTGKRLGYAVLAGAIASTPVLDAINAIVACAGGTETLISYSLKEGRKNWAMQYGPIEADLLLIDEEIYCTTLDGLAYCVRKTDGTEVWKFDSAPEGKRKPIRSAPATDGAVIIFGCDDGVLRALDRKTGTLRWQIATGASIFSAPVISEGRVLIGTIAGTILCVSAHDGQVVWKRETRVPIYAAGAASAGNFYLGASDGTLTAYDAQTGEVRWTFRTRSVVSSAPTISGGVLYVGSLDRTLYALDGATGAELWRYEAPGRIRVSPVIWKDLLLLASEDKYLLALQTQTQQPAP